MVQVLLLGLIPMASSACWMLGPADGGFKVHGIIQSDKGEPLNACSVELLDKNKKPFFGQVQTTGALLNTQFTVAPYKADYWLVISCPGHEPQRVLVRYGRETSFSKPLDLKEIVMRKEN
jgi:hypothetical protein